MVCRPVSPQVAGGDMAQLAEAYIHLQPYSVSDRKATQLGEYLNATAIEKARNIFDHRVVIHVELEEGSLRSWVTVSGSFLLGLYGGLADYKGFKESISEIVHDARTFSEAIYEPFVKKADVSRNQIYRFERRLKTPGRMQRLVKRLERLEGSVDQLSPRAIKNELYQARKELEKIEADLAPGEWQELVRIVQRPRLPPISNWPVEPEVHMPKVAIAEDHRQRSLFDSELGFMVPDIRQTPDKLQHRTVYQHRTIVDPNLRTGVQPQQSP